MNREGKRAQQREERRADRQVAAESVPAGAMEHTSRERTSPPQFLREVRSELKKVAWPNRQEVVAYTMVVLVTTLILTLYVFGLDELIRNALINIFE